jgi:hypothetical protein
MSYILDALRKADAEGSPDARTALAIEQSGRRRHRFLLYLVLVALLVNALLLIWVFYPNSDGPELVLSAPPAEEQVVLATGPPTTAVPASEATVLPAPPPATLPARSPVPVTPISRVVPFSELPAGVASRLPSLEFSTHIFSQDPALRAIVINGIRLGEGESADGLTLTEVTEDGAILGFENYLISVPVLMEWEAIDKRN